MKLPALDPVEYQRCQQLTALLQADIQRNGPMPFVEFMEKALYTPALGYYAATTEKFGAHGDFITASHLSGLFAQTVARQCAQVLQTLGEGEILEIGAGSGRFALDLLQTLEKMHSLPTHYYIYDRSEALVAQQQALFAAQGARFLPRMRWLSKLEDITVSGIIFANEVLDAMPVHCFRIGAQAILELFVTLKEGFFTGVFSETPHSPLQEKVSHLQAMYALPVNYTSEINLHLPAWIQKIASILDKGIVLVMDYGYGRKEYYHPDRMMGTLMCYFQHQRHDNPWLYPGLQDITAHVDFTTLAENENFSVNGFTTQASFLIACGILDLAENQTLSIHERNALKTLLLPGQMGELIKVMALSKNLAYPLQGFQWIDRRQDL